jgi:hypothetical protein
MYMRNKVCLVFVFMIIFVSGCAFHKEIKFQPLESSVKLIDDFQLGPQKENLMVFFKEAVTEKNEIVRVSCSGHYFVDTVRNGRLVFFLRNKMKNTDEHELWSCNADTGIIKYETQATGRFSISDNGNFLCDVIASEVLQIPPKKIYIYNLLNRSIVQEFILQTKIIDQWPDYNKKDSFWPFVEYDYKNKSFKVIMDHFGEDGPKTFYFYIAIP